MGTTLEKSGSGDEAHFGCSSSLSITLDPADFFFSSLVFVAETSSANKQTTQNEAS